MSERVPVSGAVSAASCWCEGAHTYGVPMDCPQGMEEDEEAEGAEDVEAADVDEEEEEDGR